MNRPNRQFLLPALFILSCLLLQSIRLSGDGLSYYAYLRSILFDGDLDFTNEFQEYNPLNHATPDPAIKTRTGLVANPYAVGSAVLWSPFVLATHIWLQAAGPDHHLNPPVMDGYEFPYVAGLVLGNNFFALLGILAAYDVGKRYFEQDPALIAILAVWFGTSYVNYLYFDPSYSHVLSASFVALFTWSCLRYHDRRDDWRSLILAGIVAGLMILIRWQNCVFLITPFAATIRLWLNGRSASQKETGPNPSHVVAFTGIVFVVFIPQILVWKHIYGQWLVIPMGSDFIRLLSPNLFEVLFSPRNGLFSWTPLVFIGLWGLFRLIREDRVLKADLLMVLAVQWYLNSTIIDWWGGAAFGGRRFISSSIFLALGLAGLVQISYRNSARRIAFILFLSITVVWNLLLWTQYVIATPPMRLLKDLGQIYLGQFEYGAPNVYRLFGRSTWLDLAFRSGILSQNWDNTAAAITWLLLLTGMSVFGFLLWNHLTRSEPAHASVDDSTAKIGGVQTAVSE